MVLGIFDTFFCCCRRQHDTDEVYQEDESESSRLIPDTNLGPTIYSNDALRVQQKLQERMGTIVRAKGGKMVNVGSQIPFNLHNRVLPPETHHSISRTTSGSFDTYSYTRGDFGRPLQYQQHHPHSQYPRFSTSHSPGRYSNLHSRSGSQERETRPNPVLNVRLVGFVDQRGRSRQRRPEPRLDPGSDSTVTISNMPSTLPGYMSSDSEPGSITAVSDKLKLQESGAISLSWGD